MREYQIESTHDEMGDMKFRAYTWAGDEKNAVRLWLRVHDGKDARGHFGDGAVIKSEVNARLALMVILRAAPKT